MNRNITVLIALGASLVAGAANAHGRRYQTVRVIAVEPIYETVLVRRPVDRCRTDLVERQVVSGPNVAGQTVAGAIIGAAIGRQFGDGSGRDALTVLGAVAGSAVANDRALRRQGNSTVRIVREPVRSCTTEYRRVAERYVTGYWVDYRLRGRHYRIRSIEPPGRTITIRVGS
jgi:uncharacterized protein YcfJ